MLARPLRSLRNIVTHLIPIERFAAKSANNTNGLATSTSSSDRASQDTGGKMTTPNGAAANGFRASLAAFLFFLLPSFVQRRLRPDAFKPRRLFPTSWLDGLRGVASFIVYNNHFTANYTDWYRQPYGFPRDENDHAASSPLQLLFIRNFYSGRPMVHVFFVISGFVLAYKPLKLLRAKRYAELNTTLSSSIFRRGFRLFLPITGSTFIIALIKWMGWMGQREPTLWRQLVDWKSVVFKVTFSWNWDTTQTLPYDPHLWTIPIEFVFSMVLFVTILGLSRMKTYLRLISVFCIMFYCMRCLHWAGAEFLGGMAIAEIGLIQEEQRDAVVARRQSKEAGSADVESQEPLPAASSAFLPSTTSAPRQRLLERIWHAFLILNLVFALFIASWPSKRVTEVWGFAWLHNHTMEPFYSTGRPFIMSFPWFTLCALQLVFIIQQLPALQSLFVTPLAQYLADVSFALYLCHGTVLHVFAHRWMPYFFAWSGGTEGMWSRLLAWFLGWASMGIVSFVAADIFWRTVDVRSVQFARWFESFCLRKD